MRVSFFIIAAAVVLPVAPARADCVRVAPVKVGRCDKPDPQPAQEDKRPERASRNKSKKGGAATLVQLLNSERTQRGLKPLRRRAYLDAPAARHARRMARQDQLYHNRWIHSDEGHKALGYPRTTAENVGFGGSVSSIHRAFMRSVSHRANILLEGVSEVGVAVFNDDGSLWVVQVFVQPGGRRVERASGGMAPRGISRERLPTEPDVGSQVRAGGPQSRHDAATSLSLPGFPRPERAVGAALALLAAVLLRCRHRRQDPACPPSPSGPRRRAALVRVSRGVPKGGWRARPPGRSDVHTVTEEHDVATCR